MELHDGEGEQYASCTFDLKNGEKSSGDGPLAQSNISLAEDGYFHLSLSLVPTADTEIHFTMAFLNANNGIVYPGREGKAILLRKIDIEGLPSSASVSEELAEPLIAREVKQWATAANVALQSTDGVIRVTETRGYGYHRLLGRIDGGCAAKVATLSLLAKPVGCSRIKIELRDDGAAQYVTSTFDLKSGDKLSSDGPLAQCSISPAEDGYFHLSLGLVPAADTQIHFTVTFLNAENAIVYRGREGRAVLLRKIDIQ